MDESPERQEQVVTLVALSMVSTGVLSGAGVGYFTMFLPYEPLLNALVGAVVGGLLLGLLPALLFWTWQMRSVRR